MNKPFEQSMLSDQIKTSDLLTDTLKTLPNGRISLRHLIERFNRRSFSSVFLILAMLCLLPGVSVVAGLIMIFPASQMALGFQSPRFPTFIQDYQISTESLQKWGAKVVPYVTRLEQLISHRAELLSNAIARRCIGILILLLSLVVAIPFPLSNYMPAFAVICLSLGLLERDGFMILLGVIISIAGIAFGASVFLLIWTWLFSV